MKKIILDCDPGMDDSMAIIMAAKSEKIDLLAVTTVNGNYPVDVTCKNAKKILELLKIENIPVGRGLAKPLFRDIPKDPFSHGKDGQGENFLSEPKLESYKKTAIDLIIQLVKDNPGEITIVATGPMSNIALAIMNAPEIIPLIKEIVAISGAFGLNDYAFKNATGDTPQSEWNVYVDPEAAKIIYESKIRLIALGLDVTTYFDVNFSDDDIKELEKSEKNEAKFLLQSIKFVNRRGYEAYCTVIDCMAVAYVIDPTIVKLEKHHVGVEVKDGLTLGMTVIDRRHHHVWEHLPKIEIGVAADCGRFLRLLMEIVLN